MNDKLTVKSEGKKQMIYQANGELIKHTNENWTLKFVIPIREELQPQKTKSIILFLPDLIGIDNAKSNFSISSDINNKYILGNPSSKIRILEFLKSKGKSELNVLMLGSTGNSVFNTYIDFTN